MKKYRYSSEIENVKSAAAWANEYITWFRNNREFDPLAALADTEDRDQKLFGECVAFLDEIEKAAERFRETRERIAYPVGR